MIRVYLITNEDADNFLNVADSLDVESTSLIHDDKGVNVVVIVEGVDADMVLGFYMLPGFILSRKINTIPIDDVIKISSDLSERGINTSGSNTVGELLDNICKSLVSEFNGLGDITMRDFS
tara:strand:- start:557 stop:919 length:363 start_codon:yes stop_codon:yes gene_type:complete